jgi:Cdc6-like AAA superfamily ATPase
MTDTTKLQRMTAVAQVFTPGAPVGRLDMLAGRMEQLGDIVNVVSLTGQHAALYGERGVGKTSLSNVLAEFFDSDALRKHYRAARINCSSEDDFRSLWTNVFEDLGIAREGYSEFSPEMIRRNLQSLGPTIVVLDEIDRLESDDALTAIADTIKTLSDHAVETTVVLVGVARSIGELVGEHASIVRALVQIEMPRMSVNELADILRKGCTQAKLTIEADAIEEITTLSEGLPHYTHLLGLHAAQRAVQNDRTNVTLHDVAAAIPRAVDRHTITNDYQQATRSARQDALFAEVLLACALAPKNQLGYFTSASIRDPLEVIAGRRIDIPAFSNHLSQFLEPARGSVLQREGSQRRYFYRFSDPIFQPYVILKGVSDNRISDAQRRQFQLPLRQSELVPGDFETGDHQLRL